MLGAGSFRIMRNLSKGRLGKIINDVYPSLLSLDLKFNLCIYLEWPLRYSQPQGK